MDTARYSVPTITHWFFQKGMTSGLPDYTAEEVWPAPDGLDAVEFDVAGGMGTVAFQAIIRPSGQKPWIGLFRTEDYEGALTFLETWDAGPMVLACAGGNPHFFRADGPDFRVDLATYPVMHRLRHRDLVILGDFTNLTAVDGYGLDGKALAWRLTRSLVWKSVEMSSKGREMTHQRVDGYDSYCHSKQGCCRVGRPDS